MKSGNKLIILFTREWEGYDVVNEINEGVIMGDNAEGS